MDLLFFRISITKVAGDSFSHEQLKEDVKGIQTYD